jgi:hypothetical protein
MNLFILAEKQLINEGKKPSELQILKYAIKIRKWLDLHREKTSNKILQGGKLYQYGNRLIVN